MSECSNGFSIWILVTPKPRLCVKVNFAILMDSQRASSHFLVPRSFADLLPGALVRQASGNESNEPLVACVFTIHMSSNVASEMENNVICNCGGKAWFRSLGYEGACVANKPLEQFPKLPGILTVGKKKPLFVVDTKIFRFIQWYQFEKIVFKLKKFNIFQWKTCHLI